MTMPEDLEGKIKYAFPSGPQRDALVALAAAVKLLSGKPRSIRVPKMEEKPVAFAGFPSKAEETSTKDAESPHDE